uniref:GST C-terminal domain-containing protein n=2 Tax=Brassica campestris TaxID=3711 RepID=M4D7E9_BRACM
MAAAGKLMENLAILEEAFQKSSKGLGFFGGENIGFLDLACGTLLGPVSVIEAFSGVKFLRQETTPGLIQWAEKFRAHEAVKPNMPTPEEFVAFAKKKFNVERWAFS